MQGSCVRFQPQIGRTERLMANRLILNIELHVWLDDFMPVHQGVVLKAGAEQVGKLGSGIQALVLEPQLPDSDQTQKTLGSYECSRGGLSSRHQTWHGHKALPGARQDPTNESQIRYTQKEQS